MINRVFKKSLENMTRSIYAFSNTSLINAPPAKYVNSRDALKHNTWRDIDETGKVLFHIRRDPKRHISVSLNNGSRKSQS